MRTTLDIDEDVLRTSKALARARGESVGRVISDLARRGLEPKKRHFKFRNGVPILPPIPGAKPVTPEIVKELFEAGY
jgi:hypothetical protein